MILSVKILLYKLFLDFFVAFVLLPANIIRFGITPDQSDSLTSESDDFYKKFKFYVDPNEYSTPVVNDMTVSYLKCLITTDSIRKQIRSNVSIIISGVERWILDIPTPAPFRSHVKVPDIQPAVVCVFQSSMLMKFVAFDPSAPFKRGKPKDVNSIGIKTCIVAKGAPAPDIKDYINQTPEKNIEFEMLFTADQVGKTLYIICYYLNNRNEAGKDGLAYSVTII